MKLRELIEPNVKVGDFFETERKSKFEVKDIKDYFYVIQFQIDGSKEFNMPKELFNKKYQEGKITRIENFNEIKIKPKSKAQIFFDKNIKLIEKSIKEYKVNEGNPYGDHIGYYLDKNGINDQPLPNHQNWTSDDTKELGDLINDKIRTS